MQMQAASLRAGALAPVRPALTASRSVRMVARCTETTTSTTTSEEVKAKVYIGKGKYVEDDPSKYPDKEDFGILSGATGGWAGGETGLWAFKDEIKEEMKASSSPKVEEELEEAKVRIARAKAVGEGAEDPVYIGKGKFILDDDRKYPGKQDLGFLTGVTGGFAAGEVGLKYFNENGEALIPEGKRKQFSPIVFAFIVALAGTAGVYLLDSGVQTGIAASGVTPELFSGKTRLAVQLALGIAATGGVVVASSVLVDKVKESITQVAVTIAFLAVVGAAAYAVVIN